jgi:hypothetical protein
MTATAVGHTTYVVALARALAARHEVHVAAPAGSRLLREAGALPGVHAVAQEFPNGLKQWRRADAGAARAGGAAERARLRPGARHGSADHRLVMGGDARP